MAGPLVGALRVWRHQRSAVRPPEEHSKILALSDANPLAGGRRLSSVGVPGDRVP